MKGDYVHTGLWWGKFSTGIQKLFFLMRMAYEMQNAKRAITEESFRPEFWEQLTTVA